MPGQAPLGQPSYRSGRPSNHSTALLAAGYCSAVQIREYVDADWTSLWPIFRSVVTAGETFPYDPGWSAEQAENVWVETPPGQTVVAVDSTQLLGSAKMGPNRPGRGSHVSTASFMVADYARGRGIGHALGEYALAWARGQGYAAMQFNAVVEPNHVAVRLWTALVRHHRYCAGGL